MTRDEMIQAVSDTAFVEKDDCDRVVTSYHKVIENEVKKYAIIAGAVTAFLGIFALIFYLLGKSSRSSDDE